MKRLICCLDGTWNDDRKASERTNVARLHRAILVADGTGTRQIANYVLGIATTEGQSAQFLRGAIGLEVADRIHQGFKFFAENYEPGDEIYLFGFSRGAYEARSLASFITLFGIPRRDSAFSLDEAWKIYAQRDKHREPDAVARLSAECHYPVRIRCVGVWDTVGNIGNPLLPNGLISRKMKFHDTRLHDTIDVALQALSIDEQRAPFSPTLWTLPDGVKLPAHQTVEQVWFAGTHADVGGGWTETELSDISLVWMAERASALTGLAIDIERLKAEAKPDPLGVQHDSTGGRVFVVDRYLPFIRLIKQEVTGAIPTLRRVFFGERRTGRLHGRWSINESVHESVLKRFGRRVPVWTNDGVTEQNYMPRNLVAAIGPPETIEPPKPKPIDIPVEIRPLEAKLAPRPEATAMASAMAAGMASATQAYRRTEPPPPKAPIRPVIPHKPDEPNPALFTPKTPQQHISNRSDTTPMTNDKPEMVSAPPEKGPAPSSSHIRIVTIHGTGAGMDGDIGKSWWQRDSEFYKKLSNQIDLAGKTVEVVPFHWGTGPNSETARREAGKKLFELLKSYDAEGIDYALVGHSHGGSVIYKALQYSTGKGTPLERLRTWITVGTPFLDFKPSRFLFSRLNIWGQLIYVTGAAALLFALGLIASKYLSLPLGQLVATTMGEKADRVFYLPLVSILLAYFVICHLALFITERLTKHWISDKQKVRTRDLYEKKWVGFWHQDDEAIAALANVKSLHRKIVPANFLVPAFSTIPLLATIAGSFYLFFIAARDLRADNPKVAEAIQKMNQVDLNEATRWTPSSLLQSLLEILQFVIVIAGPLLAIYLLVTSVAILVSKIVAWIIGHPLSSAIDSLVWSSVRQQAWGNDRRGEYIRKVSNHPPLFDTRYVALPAAVASNIARLSESQAGETLRRARELLGMSVGAESTGDIGRDLASQLTWKELIHTCYFDIDEFVRVVGQTLRYTGCAPAKAITGADSDAETWLGECAAQGSQPWWADKAA